MSLFSQLGIVAFRLFRNFLRIFPLSVAPRLGRVLGRFCSLFCLRERKIVEVQAEYVLKHIRKAGFPEVSEIPETLPRHHLDVLENVSALSTKVFEHAGEFAGETFILDRLLKRNPNDKQFRYITSTGQEFMKRYTSGDSATIALSAHIGCFELLAGFHAANGIDLVVIGRDPNYAVMSAALKELRRSYGVDTIWRNDPSSARKLLGSLKTAGRLVGVLIDQDTALNNAFSPFFGLDAAYPVGPITLAIKKNIPIVSTFIVRTNLLHHHVITRVIPYDPSDPDAVKSILQTYGSHLEDLILRFPEQWFWWHRRWRRRPGVDYSPGKASPLSASAYCAWMSSLATHKTTSA